MVGLSLFVYVAVAVFMVGLIYRAISIKRMPVHLRWGLAPVPHEKGKAAYGGSYLEEFEWWTKKREKSLISEGWAMFQEIILLKGVFENNRTLWLFSFPFHFGGLYLTAGAIGLMVLTALLQIAGVQYNPLITLINLMAAAGYILGTAGVIGLFIKRLLDSNVRPFSTFATYFNLAFLFAVFVSGLYAATRPDNFALMMTGFIKSLIVFKFSATLSDSVTLHIIVGSLFLIYLPFTYMMHFVAKYFTYHEVRWNDEPMTAGSKMEKEVQTLLSQKVTWSAPHIQGQGKKTWVDVATEEVKDEKTK